MNRKLDKQPELTFQRHIADFLVWVHGYGVLEQIDIIDAEHCIAEDQLWAFLNTTQADQIKKLKDDYSTDARERYSRMRCRIAPRPSSSRTIIQPAALSRRRPTLT
jgi:hypothetical protein